jgi:arginine decarboxylase
MRIQVISSRGEGNTPLSAFDSALYSAGINLYNLIPLSSVIPLGTQIVRVKKFSAVYDERGYRLYVVIAERRSDDPDIVIGAGLGWYPFKTGGGVFVEHKAESYAASKVRIKLESQILASLSDLCKIRSVAFERKNAKMSLSISKPKNLPHCALTVAVYKAESW